MAVWQGLCCLAAFLAPNLKCKDKIEWKKSAVPMILNFFLAWSEESIWSSNINSFNSYNPKTYLWPSRHVRSRSKGPLPSCYLYCWWNLPPTLRGCAPRPRWTWPHLSHSTMGSRGSPSRGRRAPRTVPRTHPGGQFNRHYELRSWNWAKFWAKFSTTYKFRFVSKLQKLVGQETGPSSGPNSVLQV